jgi:hypothetical protein
MPFLTFLSQLYRRTQVINVETWYKCSKDIGLMKKIGFEIFNKIGISFLLIFDVLIGWRLFVF